MQSRFYRAALLYVHLVMHILNYLLIVLFAFTACNNAGDKTLSKGTTKDSISVNEYKPKTGLEAEPLISKTDSLQIIYYDDPDGDSLRYTRFYSYLSSTDSGFIQQVVQQLNQPFQQLNENKPCRSEGKIYLYQKAESAKTIYFSTRCDSCCYLYFIKDGAFLYFPMAPEVGEIIKKKKSEAQKP